MKTLGFCPLPSTLGFTVSMRIEAALFVFFWQVCTGLLRFSRMLHGLVAILLARTLHDLYGAAPRWWR